MIIFLALLVFWAGGTVGFLAASLMKAASEGERG